MIVGTLPAIPTPLTSERRVDEHALANLLDRLFTAGVDGAVALGTSGEGVTLDSDRRRRVLAVACAVNPGRTVVAGCFGNSHVEILEAIEWAADSGCAAALVPPPFYYPASQGVLVDSYEYLAQRAPIPIVLYHIPARTGNRLLLPSVAHLATVDNVVGIKDSDGDAAFHLELLALQGDAFAVMQGVAPLVVWSYLSGARGAITPVSALAPEWELEIRRAVGNGDVAGLRTRAVEMNVLARLFRYGDLPLVSNVKALAEALGIFERWVEPPLPTASDQHVEELRRELAASEIAALAASAAETSERSQ